MRIPETLAGLVIIAILCAIYSSVLSNAKEPKYFTIERNSLSSQWETSPTHLPDTTITDTVIFFDGTSVINTTHYLRVKK